MGAFLPPPGQPDPKMDPKFRSGSQPALVSFAFDKIGPPSTLYIQRDDVLSIRAVSSLVGESVSISVRLLLPVAQKTGQPDTPPQPESEARAKAGNFIQTNLEKISLPVARVQGFLIKQLAEGYLLSVVAGPGLATFRGQTYVSALLSRDKAGGIPLVQGLFGDYVAGNQVALYPGGRTLHLTEGPGWKHSIQQANPAAGADWTFTVAAGQRLRLESLSAQLVAANAGVARAVELIVDDGVNVLLRVAANATQPINTTARYSIGALSTPSTIIATDLIINIPTPLILEPGWRVRTNTVNINPADQWSAIWLNVEEWLDAL